MYNLRKRTNDNVPIEASDWEPTTRCFVENRGNYLPERRTKDMIAGHYRQRRAAGIEVAALKVRLICPLTKRRIVVPARSVNCTHLQCFDLAGFLRMQMNAEHPIWTCPICRVPADTGRLQIDECTSKMLATEQAQGAEEITLLQDGTFEPVVPNHPSGVVTQEDLDFVVDENSLDVEDVKPVIDRRCSASNDSFADRASSEKPGSDVNEPSAPAKRARLDATLATVDTQPDQPECHVDSPETSQDATQARTPSSLPGLQSIPGQHEQTEAVVDVRPPTAAKCRHLFTSKKSFAEHRAECHFTKPTPGPCTQCSARSENVELYHCEYYHEVKPFSCTKCPRSFLKEDELDGHGREHDSEYRAGCPSCGGIYRHPQTLTAHRKEAHLEKINWCFRCKDVFFEDEQEHVSSDAHQESLKLKAICDELKLSCANCSKRKTGTQFLFVDGIQSNVRRWSLAKNCEACRMKLVKAGKPPGESERTDMSEIWRMLGEQEPAVDEMKRMQERAALLLEAQKAREAQKKPDQMAQAQVSSTRVTSSSPDCHATHPAQAHHVQVQQGPWLQAFPTASAFGIPSYPALGATLVRNNFMPTASSQGLPQPGQCPPFPPPPLRPPPTAERHVMDEYYRLLGMFYDQWMRRYPY